MITRVCLLVGSFVRSFARCDNSKTSSPVFMKFVTDAVNPRQMSMLSFERSRSKFKVICFVHDPPYPALD